MTTSSSQAAPAPDERNREINIVSRSVLFSGVTGPGKVVRNTMKGLERIGQPFRLNAPLDACPWLWVHDDSRALLELPRHGTVTVLGPNIAVLPQDLPTSRRFDRSVFLHPSEWAVQVWRKEGFAQCELRTWPTGIDTERWPQRDREDSAAPVLLYFKQRTGNDLREVGNALRQAGFTYELFGHEPYAEGDYAAALRRCSFVVWLGRQESQGIALQEALASGVPMVVVDALTLFDVEPMLYKFPERLRALRTTSAPYFDTRCGRIVVAPAEVSEAALWVRDNLARFRPREFVIERLGLERQAKELVGLFEELESRHGDVERPGQEHRGESFKPKLSTRVRVRVHQTLRDPAWVGRALSRRVLERAPNR